MLREALQTCIDAVGASGGSIYLHDKENKRLLFRHVMPEEVARNFPFTDIPDDFGVAGSVFHTRRAEISDFPEGGDPERRGLEQKTGVVIRTMITVPLNVEDEEPIGIVQLTNKRDGKFDQDDEAVLDTVSAISTMAFINAKLVAEQARALQLLGMGKIAHDMKNLAFALEANLLYARPTIQELRMQLEERIPWTESLEEINTLDEMIRDMQFSIERMKSYSVLVSDLSAGKRLEPNLSVSRMSEAIENAASFLESEARKSGIEIRYEIQKDAPPVLHDEMYVSRIVQNLTSNAIRAVRDKLPDELEEAAFEEDVTIDFITISYRFDGDRHLLEVRDNGLGMPSETIERILTGTATSRWTDSSGSGWGTKIVMELALAQDATVEVDSTVGQGTTFRVIFPA